ncbi:TolC family protein [Litorilituus lipolyticus]|uniref:TolC family protein n=1 Tax=Litorilituus lipolyticus TaxID=2491017 RepID=A0A502L5W6_9GAMM|nr:TolC family protein [Litorilituus lipolyticus]TPH19282.1 TolC family protein [Litorilituus lipolyticus]
MPYIKSQTFKPLNYWLRGGVAALTLNLFLGNPFAYAQQEVTLKDAVLLTLNQHAELQSFVHAQNVNQGLIQQAGVSSPLSLRVEVEDAFGTGSYSGLSAMQATVGVSWLLENDVINSRVGVANEQSAWVSLQKEIKALDVAAETANIFVVLLSQKEQLTLAKLAQLQAKKVLEVISKQVDLGKANIIDQLRAKADLSTKALEVEDLIHEIEASKAQLAAQWQGNMNFTVSGTLQRIPTETQLDLANEQLINHPRIKLYATEQRIAEAEIALAKVTAKPSWQVFTGVKRNEAEDDFALTASISIPLGSENRNQGEIIALQAKGSQKQAESEALSQRISTQILLLTHKLKHNRHVIEGLSTETIPALEQANEKAKQAYQIGRYRYSEWNDIQQDLLDAQAELIQAFTNIQLFNIELERLTGRSIMK